MYRIPSELRQGDACTSSGIVNGSFQGKKKQTTIKAYSHWCDSLRIYSQKRVVRKLQKSQMTGFCCLFILLQCLRTQNFRSRPCSANPEQREVCLGEFTIGEMHVAWKNYLQLRCLEAKTVVLRSTITTYKLSASTYCGLITSPIMSIKCFSIGLYSNICKGQVSSYK